MSFYYPEPTVTGGFFIEEIMSTDNEFILNHYKAIRKRIAQKLQRKQKLFYHLDDVCSFIPDALAEMDTTICGDSVPKKITFIVTRTIQRFIDDFRKRTKYKIKNNETYSTSLVTQSLSPKQNFIKDTRMHPIGSGMEWDEHKQHIIKLAKEKFPLREKIMTNHICQMYISTLVQDCETGNETYYKTIADRLNITEARVQQVLSSGVIQKFFKEVYDI